MRSWMLLLPALTFAACSGDDESTGTTDDSGTPVGDDDDGTDDPVDDILALSGDSAAGMTVYEDNSCGVCHGDNGEGGTGNNLQVELDEREVVETIYYGSGIMSAYGDALSDQEVADVAAYVATFAP